MSAFDYDMISRYVDGEMTAEERRTFEEMMQADKELQKEVELYKEVNSSLQRQLYPDESETALKGSLEKLRPQYFSSKKDKSGPARVISFKRWMAAAAMIIILITAGIVIWSPWKKDLYERYAYIQMPSPDERGEPADSLLKKVTEQFNHKNFSASLPLFESILRIDSGNASVHYYYAIALMQSDQPERSRNEFTRLYNGVSLFKYDAAYYMALSYLKEKNTDKTKEWLNNIPANAAIYKKAQELLKRL